MPSDKELRNRIAQAARWGVRRDIIQCVCEVYGEAGAWVEFEFLIQPHPLASLPAEIQYLKVKKVKKSG